MLRDFKHLPDDDLRTAARQARGLPLRTRHGGAREFGGRELGIDEVLSQDSGIACVSGSKWFDISRVRRTFKSQVRTGLQHVRNV